MVCWKEAADRNDSVFSEALVIPRQFVLEAGGLLALGQQFVVDIDHIQAVDVITGQQFGIAGAGHHHFGHHLADDDFKVLIVDVLALRAVHLLHLREQVNLAGFPALDAQNRMRVEGTFSQRLSRGDLVASAHDQACIGRNLVFHLLR